VSRSDLTPAMREALLVAARLDAAGSGTPHGRVRGMSRAYRAGLLRISLCTGWATYYRPTTAGLDALRALVST
jgi:hypothetical protein